MESSLMQSEVFRDVALCVPDRVSWEDWQELGEVLSAMQRSSSWWLGDWWNAGEKRWGERAAQATGLGVSAGTLSTAAWVASRIEPQRRRSGVSFAHHQAVAARSPEEQDRWLDVCEREGWTVAELRRRVKGLILSVDEQAQMEPQGVDSLDAESIDGIMESQVAGIVMPKIVELMHAVSALGGTGSSQVEYKADDATFMIAVSITRRLGEEVGNG